jgi:cytochrome bd-type quinol oxidase subunit 2
MPETEPADRQQRRVAFIVLAVGLVVGVIVLLLAQAHLREIEDLIERDRDAGTSALIETIRWFIVFLVIPMAGLLGYLAWFALRIIRGQRFPPLGTRVLRNTAVLEGRRAVVRGWILALVTLLTALAVLQLAVALWALADELATHQDRVQPPASIDVAPR